MEARIKVTRTWLQLLPYISGSSVIEQALPSQSFLNSFTIKKNETDISTVTKSSPEISVKSDSSASSWDEPATLEYKTESKSTNGSWGDSAPSEYRSPVRTDDSTKSIGWESSKTSGWESDSSRKPNDWEPKSTPYKQFSIGAGRYECL